ncbi:MAG TPA: winged helix-turn-helix domain-containing protein [Thermoanaerobaculia bacterium]
MPKPASPSSASPPPAAAFGSLVRPRIRVLHGADVALGPGKVALLAAIAEHGCLTAAAESLGMSYMRAWRLIQTMNACFREPLVASRRGGKQHGGASLTGTGRRVLALYRQMEQASVEAIAPTWDELRAYLG